MTSVSGLYKGHSFGDFDFIPPNTHLSELHDDDLCAFMSYSHPYGMNGGMAAWD